MADVFFLTVIWGLIGTFPLLIIIFIQKIFAYEMLRIKYSEDVLERSAEVYVYRIFKANPQYFKYRFYMAEDDKWKYEPKFTNIKARLFLFAVGYVYNLLFYAYINSMNHNAWPPRITDMIFTAILWLLAAFGTLLTDPLEAYIILQIDLRRKESGSPKKEGYRSAKQAVISFWWAMADCSKEEIAQSFIGAGLTDDNTYKQIQECIDKQYAVASQYQGDVILHVDKLKIRHIEEFNPKSLIYEGEPIDKLYVCLVDIPGDITLSDHTQEGLIKYGITTVKIHKRWYIFLASNMKDDKN